MNYIDLGFGNQVDISRIIGVCGTTSSPLKKIIKNAEDDSRLFNVCCGRKARSIIVTDGNGGKAFLFLSYKSPQTITNLINQKKNIAELIQDKESTKKEKVEV